MSWGSWTSSVRETFLVPIWYIGSANSLRLKNLKVEMSLILWASASLVCSKSVSKLSSLLSAWIWLRTTKGQSQGFPWLILPHGIVIMTAFDQDSFPLAACSLWPSAKPGVKEVISEGCCMVTAQESSPPASFLEVPGRKDYLAVPSEPCIL